MSVFTTPMYVNEHIAPRSFEKNLFYYIDYLLLNYDGIYSVIPLLAILFMIFWLISVTCCQLLIQAESFLQLVPVRFSTSIGIIP